MPHSYILWAVLGMAWLSEARARRGGPPPRITRKAARYALSTVWYDTSKARRELGWAPRRTFEEGLAATVRWYVESRVWWERVQSEAYRVANAMYL